MSDKDYKELEDIVNKSPAIAFLWRNVDDWPVEFVTDNIKQFGYDPSEFLSEKIKYAEIVHKDDLERVAEEVEIFSSSGVEEFTQEYRILTKEGKVIWIDDRTWIRRNLKGEITHYQGVILDISDRKLLEKELIKSEERYQLISENANDAISVFDEKFRFEYINENIHKSMMGYDKEELIGKNGILLIHPDDQYIALEALKNIATFNEGSGVTRIKNKKGDYIWTESKGTTFYDSNGAKKFLLITRDISERKKYELKLKKSEEKYRLISENANDLITVFDEKFRFEYINESIHKSMMGYNKEELIGKSGFFFVHPEDQKGALDAFKNVANFNKGSGEARIKNKKGEYIWTESKGTTFYDNNGVRKYLLITRDISERKQYEQKLKESEVKYRIAYERENFYKDLFTHDIKNILQGILSSLELSKLELNKSGVESISQSIFNDIVNLISRGSNLIKNVRKFSEFDELNVKLTETELIDTIKDTFEIIKHSVKKKKVKVSYDLASESTLIYANELLIDVVENILLNAIVHNENEDVEILIKTKKITKAGKIFNKVEFIDNGKGVPDFKKDLIFNRGFSEEKNTTGMGLGLSLVKIILKAYNAKIWVEDKKPGDFSMGSNFIILFPEVSK